MASIKNNMRVSKQDGRTASEMIFTITVEDDDFKELHPAEVQDVRRLLFRGDTGSLLEAISIVWNATQERRRHEPFDPFADLVKEFRDSASKFYDQNYDFFKAQAQQNRSQGRPQSSYSPTGWWTVLGISSSATKSEIKTAYRKLALKHHPDKGGDAATFNKITTAYKEALA